MFASTRIQTLGVYELGDRLGIGGMAEVYAARSKEQGRVALKRILPGLAEDAEFADMFWDEARIMSRLDHPNIVRILDYGRANAQLYMALEYVDGPNLARVLRKAAKARQPLSLPVLVSIIVQLLDALEYVHVATDARGKALKIVHRDVSPGNVMLTGDGHAKLSDFGIVRSQAVMRRTQPGELKGKVGYMSPEQAIGEAVNRQSDIFSVGIILAEFLTLRPLFLGKTEMQTLSRMVHCDLSTWHRHNGNVPLGLRVIVEKALQKELDQRYHSAKEMRAALMEVARTARWELRPGAVVQELRGLDLLPPEQEKSGERPVVREPFSFAKAFPTDAPLIPDARTTSVSSEEIMGGSQGAVSRGRITPITQNAMGMQHAEIPTVAHRSGLLATSQSPATSQSAVISHAAAAQEAYATQNVIGVARRPQGRPVWDVVASRTSLPSQLFLALRRAWNGVVELSHESDSLSMEIQAGRIVATHDSSGAYPLGRLLIEASLVDMAGLVQAIGGSRRANLRLGEFLVLHGRLRESTLQRLLRRQMELRLGPWLNRPECQLALFLKPHSSPLVGDSERYPASLAEVVGAWRPSVDVAELEEHLHSVMDSVVLPALHIPITTFGLTEPEVRAVRTAMDGGAYEGRSVRSVIENVVGERIARRREVMFGLLVALSGGVVQAPGYGR